MSHLLFLTALNFSKISNVKKSNRSRMRKKRLTKRRKRSQLQLIKLRLLSMRRTLSLSFRKLSITLNITNSLQAMKRHMSLMRRKRKR